MVNPDCDYLGTYTSMVKSGEEYYTDRLDLDAKGFIQNVSERPRNICAPAASGCGLLTFIQSLLWDNIKKIIPGFIQGLTKDQMKDVFEKQIGKMKDPVSLSMDSSAFDSSQHGYI